MFGRKQKPAAKKYDPDRMQPAVLASICTGEKTAGFLDRETGKFSGVCLIRDDRDLKSFLKEYGIPETELKTVY